MKNILILGILLLASCAHRPPICLKNALNEELACLRADEDPINKNFTTGQDKASINKCRMLYKVVYKQCIIEERDKEELRQRY